MAFFIGAKLKWIEDEFAEIMKSSYNAFDFPKATCWGKATVNSMSSKSICMQIPSKRNLI